MTEAEDIYMVKSETTHTICIGEESANKACDRYEQMDDVEPEVLRLTQAVNVTRDFIND